MDIKVGAKIHNRFDIEVVDITTGEVVQKGMAENIVLNNMYNLLCSNDGTMINKNIAYGRGTGTISASRTTLFNKIDSKVAEVIETKINPKGTPSYCKKVITILPTESIGDTLTEIGVEGGVPLGLRTHALIKDAEGNPISIGPKTDLQQIFIYSTVYAEVTLPDFVDLIVFGGSNELLSRMIGNRDTILHTNTVGSNYIQLALSTRGDVTDSTNIDYSATDNAFFTSVYKVSPFGIYSIGARTSKTPRVRFESADANQVRGIRSMLLKANHHSGTNNNVFLRATFPNSWFEGYHFTNKNIGVGDGVTQKFVLHRPYLNEFKEYKFYIDGVLQIKDADYILSNAVEETSITFINPPIIKNQITGDWWVDYIPKDGTMILDFTLTITYGEWV